MERIESSIPQIVERLDRELPHFPDGRIDYSKSELSPVITIFVQFQGKILLLKRSDKVGNYQGKWNTVAGFIDRLETLAQKAGEELTEELGITPDNIQVIEEGEPYQFSDESIRKTWVVYPVIVELKSQPEIILDWEHTDYVWIKPEEITSFDTVPKLEESLQRMIHS